MLRILLLLPISLTIAGCTTEMSNSGEKQIEDNLDIIDYTAPRVVDSSYYGANVSVEEDSLGYSYKVMYEENNGWGYQIFEGDKMVINQMHIPAVQGIQGFSSQENAATTARYIIKKINEGIFPPTISVSTLDSLRVL